MSKQRRIKHMTSEELKEKLFMHFQKNGSFDNLKSQLRGQLISELIKRAEPVKNNAFPPASDTDKCLLPLQVCNWLVYDHLLRQDYQYALSVFVMEAQIPFPEKFLTAGDILGILGLNQHKTDAENISKLYAEKNELDCLHSLLLSIIKVIFNVPLKISMHSSNIDDDKTDQVRRKESSETKEQTHSSLDFRHQTNSKRLSLDKSVISNSAEKSLEISFQEQLESVKEKNEKEVQRLRQKLLQELEKLHEQEHKMQLEVEFKKAELKEEHMKLLRDTELLKEKESLLEKEISNKCERKARDVETDFASQLSLKRKELEDFEEKLKEKEQELSSVKAELLNEKNHQNVLQRELEEVKHIHQVIQDKYAALLDENTHLLKKFENMADYAIIKEELAAKSKQVLQLQHEIRDIHHKSEIERRKYVETVRSLEDNLGIKEPQLVEAQKELDSVKDTLSREQSMWNRERKKLEQELKTFKESHRNLVQRVEDQEEDIKDLNKTIYTLNYKFTNSLVPHKRGAILDNRNYQVSGNNFKNKSDRLFDKRVTSYPTVSSGNANDWSLQFISDAKSRFDQLKEEECKVQEHCFNIFCSIPGSNKPELPFTDSNTVPKFNTGDYNFQTVDKPESSNTNFNFDDWYKNKVAAKKSPYALNDIKHLVAKSLFPGNTSYNTKFHSNIGFLESLPKSTSKVNDWFNNSFTHPVSFTELQNENIFNKDNLTNLDEPDKNSRTIKEKTSVSFSTHNERLPKTESNDKQISQNQEVSPINKSQLEVKTRNKVDLINTEATKTDDKNLTSNPGESPESTTLSKNNESSTILANPVSVNLDDAWKRRTSNATVVSLLQRSNTNEARRNSSLTMFNPFLSPNRKSVPELKNKEFSELGHKTDTINDSVSLTEHDHDKSSEFELLENIQKPERESALDRSSQKLQSSLNLESKNSVADQPKLVPGSIENSTSELEKHEKNLDLTLNSSGKNQIQGDFLEEKVMDKNEDSVSELSEIQLSCGSEPGEQKEDSDAW